MNKFPKSEKVFTILNSFLIFEKVFSRSGGLLPEMSSDPIHLKFESRDEELEIRDWGLGVTSDW